MVFLGIEGVVNFVIFLGLLGVVDFMVMWLMGMIFGCVEFLECSLFCVRIWECCFC